MNMNRKFILFFAVALLVWILCPIANAQNLDRMSLSSGGAAGDNVNYVLGETFNFTMAAGGSDGISLESGSLSSEENTGGDIPTILQNASELPSQIECYPNAVSDILTVDFNGTEGVTGVAVFSIPECKGVAGWQLFCVGDERKGCNSGKKGGKKQLTIDN